LTLSAVWCSFSPENVWNEQNTGMQLWKNAHNLVSHALVDWVRGQAAVYSETPFIHVRQERSVLLTCCLALTRGAIAYFASDTIFCWVQALRQEALRGVNIGVVLHQVGAPFLQTKYLSQTIIS
jgi:hypothetical protein